jgi:polyhydroxyalkanoate synthase subunit PhaC
MAAAALDEPTARLATTASATRGYLDGRTLAEVFAWLRPNDLIWNYWVNKYPRGRLRDLQERRLPDLRQP